MIGSHATDGKATPHRRPSAWPLVPARRPAGLDLRRRRGSTSPQPRTAEMARSCQWGCLGARLSSHKSPSVDAPLHHAVHRMYEAWAGPSANRRDDLLHRHGMSGLVHRTPPCVLRACTFGPDTSCFLVSAFCMSARRAALLACPASLVVWLAAGLAEAGLFALDSIIDAFLYRIYLLVVVRRTEAYAQTVASF